MDFNENKLKKLYIETKTKDWDSETKDKYISNVEEDFKEWFSGYKYAIDEISSSILPVLEFTVGKVKSEAGVFQLHLKNAIKKLKQ